jgi:hypothetical protein
MYCPDHDPILAAGCIACGTCGAKAFPVSAEWLGEDLILAAFDRTECGHKRDPYTIIIIPSRIGEEFASPPARTRSEVAEMCGTTCAAITSTTGMRCRNLPKDGGLCGVHNARGRPR